MSDDEVAVLKGWSKVAEDERATKEAFDTFRSMRDDPITAAPTTPPASVKGYSREELLALRDAAPEGPVVLEGEKRRLPAVRWSACDKRATSNGAAASRVIAGDRRARRGRRAASPLRRWRVVPPALFAGVIS